VAQEAQKDTRFEHRMSPGEALMWNVEKDPWLNPSGASVSVVDGEIEDDALVPWLRRMVADVPRLRERVRHGVGRFTTPAWVPDPEFDVGYHYRHIALPAPGTERQLLDLVGILFREPYDRTRPPWQIIVIGGIEGGRSALMMKLHHTIADGYGMGRLQQRFMLRDPKVPPPDPVDLDAIVAETCARADAARAEAAGTPLNQVARVATAPAELSWRITGRLGRLVTDRKQLENLADTVGGTVRMGLSQLRPGANLPDEPQSDAAPADGDARSGSPLWTGRSARRHLELLDVSFEDARRASKALGGSLNDLFLTALTGGAVAYHEKRGAPARSFNSSFVVSTREDKAEGGNSFSPLRVQMPGGAMSPVDRFQAIQRRIAKQRDALRGGGLMGNFARVANLLPTSVTTKVARSSAAHLDFATSNVRGSRRPLYIGGHQQLQLFAPGPVAGSAMIVSLISYLDRMGILFTMDPAAVEDPADLRRDVGEAFEELFAVADVRGS
jgi:WS/DGAT/MGAT family acyltransferase